MAKINDPKQYALAGMAEMGLANFFQACAEACSISAGKCGPSESEQAYANKWRDMEQQLLALMHTAENEQMHHPFILE
jgi:hypothetical protein